MSFAGHGRQSGGDACSVCSGDQFLVSLSFGFAHRQLQHLCKVLRVAELRDGEGFRAWHGWRFERGRYGV